MLQRWILRFLFSLLLYLNRGKIYALLFAKREAKEEKPKETREVESSEYDEAVEELVNKCIELYYSSAWKPYADSLSQIGKIKRGDVCQDHIDLVELVACIKLSHYDKRLLKHSTLTRVNKSTTIQYKLASLLLMQQEGRFPTSNRDYVTLSHSRSLSPTLLLLCSTSTDYDYPLAANTVRAKLIVGCWFIDTAKNKISYIINVDPMGYIPSSILDPVLQKAPLIINTVLEHYSLEGPPPFLVESMSSQDISFTEALKDNTYSTVIVSKKQDVELAFYVPKRHFTAASFLVKFKKGSGNSSACSLNGSFSQKCKRVVGINIRNTSVNLEEDDESETGVGVVVDGQEVSNLYNEFTVTISASEKWQLNGLEF